MEILKIYTVVSVVINQWERTLEISNKLKNCYRYLKDPPLKSWRGALQTTAYILFMPVI
jgi:hypothetical protein